MREIELINQIQAAKESSENKQKIESLQNALAMRFKKIVYSKTRKYRQYPNYEDLVQEGFCGLVRAARKYDPSKEASFYTYASIWVSSCVNRAASKNAVVYDPNRGAVVYMDVEEEDTGKGPYEQAVMAQECGLVNDAISKLSAKEKYVFKAIYDGTMQKDVSLDLGVTAENVRVVKNRAIAKIKNVLGKKGIMDV